MRYLLLSVFLILVNNSFSQNLTSQLFEIKEKYNVVGMSVCVMQHGQEVFSKNLGLRDIGRNLEVTDSTVYRIASISKMVTVTALMQLYDKGLFKLNDDVSKYLGFELRNPNFHSVPITFSMLMSHTSGLRDGGAYDNFLGASYRNDSIPPLSSVLLEKGSYSTDDMWAKSAIPAGGFFTYANINFGILGTLVEKISGERFDKYCLEHIFRPMGLTASFDVRDIPDINNVAAIYRKVDNNWTAQTDNWKGIRPPYRNLKNYNIGSNAVIFAPQGGLRISAKDLARFMNMHQNNGDFKGYRILSDSTARRMHQIVWKFNGSNGDTEKEFFTTYSLGCMQTGNLLPGVNLLGHSGDAYGLLSDMYYSEKDDLGIVFITNGGEWKAGNYSGWQNVEEDIFNACYKELKKPFNGKIE